MNAFLTTRSIETSLTLQPHTHKFHNYCRGLLVHPTNALRLPARICPEVVEKIFKELMYFHYPFNGWGLLRMIIRRGWGREKSL